ncbi:MAG: trigger factor [Candidatus Paceibacterota bacterium]
MKYTKKSSNKSEHTFEVIYKKDEIKKLYDAQFELSRKKLSVEGFRVGKVPAKIAKKSIEPDAIYTEILHGMVASAFRVIVDKESLKPISSPKLDVSSAKKDDDWVFTLTIPVKPDIKLPDYKSIVQAVKKKHKSADIWTPGKTLEKKDQEKKQAEKQVILNEILKELLEKTMVEVPGVLVEQEVEKRLAGIVDDVRKIGLTVEAYLRSKGKTMDSLKKQYKKEVVDSFKLELILDKLADTENITVEKDELDKFLAEVQKQDKTANIKEQAYFYSMLLRRQKLFDFLISL